MRLGVMVEWVFSCCAREVTRHSYASNIVTRH